MVRTYNVSLVIDPEIASLVPGPELAQALTSYTFNYLYPSWQVCAQVQPEDKPGDWNLYILANADQCACLGIHQVNSFGIPQAFVNVAECRRFGWPISAVASHELAELITNPAGNAGYRSPSGTWAAMEIADPCQGYTFLHQGFAMADFVTPAWFGQPIGENFDLMQRIPSAWELAPGGYLPVYEQGEWSNVWGSLARHELYNREDRRLHRTERLPRW